MRPLPSLTPFAGFLIFLLEIRALGNHVGFWTVKMRSGFLCFLLPDLAILRFRLFSGNKLPAGLSITLIA
jgi:hypothetical protein